MTPGAIEALERYAVAVAHHRFSSKKFNEASRLFDRLSRRMNGDRAYEMAGVTLADRRMIQDAIKQENARLELAAIARASDIAPQVQITGRAMFIEGRTAESANDNSAEPARHTCTPA